MATALKSLRKTPQHFPDLCPGVSRLLIAALVNRLPQAPAITLSVGCGSGLLEAILLDATTTAEKAGVNIYGIEVPPCVNKHLPEERLLRVPCTQSIHPDAMLASAVMFIYPRQASLVAKYLDAFLYGALEKVFWLGHRNDWADVEKLLMAAFVQVELIGEPHLPGYELLAVATNPRHAMIKGPLSLYDSPSKQATADLTSEQLDIWEHAVLLFHGYEWQTAAETFLRLAQTIENVRERAISYINAGLIYARRGDFLIAADAFEYASQFAPTCLIATFLFALVACELKDYSLAEHCFELCWAGLDCHEAKYYEDDRLKFALDQNRVQANIVLSRQIQFSTRFPKSPRSPTIHLNGVPAACIFEAPSRSKLSHPASLQRRRSSKKAHSLPKGNSIEETLAPPARSSHESESIALQLSPRGPATFKSPLSSLQDKLMKMSQAMKSTANVAENLKSKASPYPSSVISESGIKHKSWHHRPHTPYTPRDARGEYPDSNELVRWIKCRGNSTSTSLTPRHAKGEYPSLESQIHLFRKGPSCQRDTMAQTPCYDRQNSSYGSSDHTESGEAHQHAVATPTCEVNTKRRSLNRSNTAPERNLGLTRFASRIRSRTSLDRLGLQQPPSATTCHTSKSMFKEMTLELLHPTVFNPHTAKAKNSTYLDESPSSSHTVSSNQDSSATTVSSSSSYYQSPQYAARKDRCRKETLRALERQPTVTPQHGNLRVKASTSDKSLPQLPPDPSGGSQGKRSPRSLSTVATEKFFDMVRYLNRK